MDATTPDTRPAVLVVVLPAIVLGVLVTPVLPALLVWSVLLSGAHRLRPLDRELALPPSHRPAGGHPAAGIA